MSQEVKSSSCECSCNCRGCVCRRHRPTTARTDDGVKGPIRRAKERIRVNENVHWRDQAINDFTGNLSGLIGIKKILHSHRTAPASKRKTFAHRNGANKKRVTKIKPTKPIGERKSELLTEEPTLATPLDDKSQENDQNVSWRPIRKSIILENFKRSLKPEIELNGRSEQPTITKISEELPEKPTVELDISSEDDGSFLTPAKKSTSDDSSRSTRQIYASRLFSNNNQRVTEKQDKTSRWRDEKVTGRVQKEGDLWRTRGEVLLGYDFVAGSVDNLPFLSSIGESHRRLKEFREANREECQVLDDGEEGTEEKTKFPTSPAHHCLHSYRINERLFAETEDRSQESVCGICFLLRGGQMPNRPVHLSISVPTEAIHRTRKRAPLAGKGRVTSLALMQNCDFKFNEASRR